jgi:hypothetical protein
VLFYDAIVLNGYLFLNVVIGWNVLEAERNGTHYQSWLKPLIYISIPWAVSIHTVTAYLYCGLPGRHFWLTAILAPRFLASAFAAGPALLILLCLFIRRFTNFDPGKEQIQTLAKTVAYAICINVFFFLCEVFVAFYSNSRPHHPPQVPVRGPARRPAMTQPNDRRLAVQPAGRFLFRGGVPVYCKKFMLGRLSSWGSLWKKRVNMVSMAAKSAALRKALCKLLPKVKLAAR